MTFLIILFEIIKFKLQFQKKRTVTSFRKICITIRLCPTIIRHFAERALPPRTPSGRSNARAGRLHHAGLKRRSGLSFTSPQTGRFPDAHRDIDTLPRKTATVKSKNARSGLFPYKTRAARRRPYFPQSKGAPTGFRAGFFAQYKKDASGKKARPPAPSRLPTPFRTRQGCRAPCSVPPRLLRLPRPGAQRTGCALLACACAKSPLKKTAPHRNTSARYGAGY